MCTQLIRKRKDQSITSSRLELGVIKIPGSVRLPCNRLSIGQETVCRKVSKGYQGGDGKKVSSSL